MKKNIFTQSFYFYHKAGIMLLSLKFMIFSRGEYMARKASFHESLDQYRDLNNYISLFNNTANLNATLTNQFVEPKTLGMNTQSIKAEYGTPDFIFNDNKLKIFVYKRKLGELRMRIQIHFYNNIVFLFQYTYDKIDDYSRKTLLKSLLMRYFSEDFSTTAGKIIDKRHNISFINDSPGSLAITNLSGKESGWFADMEQEIDLKRKLIPKYPGLTIVPLVN